MLLLRPVGRGGKGHSKRLLSHLSSDRRIFQTLKYSQCILPFL